MGMARPAKASVPVKNCDARNGGCRIRSMKPSTSVAHFFGALSLALGILAAFLLAGGLSWAGLEASQYYGFTRLTNERMGGLSCPRLMTRGETGTVQLSVYNPSDLEITPLVDVLISKAGLPAKAEVQLTVPPGQTRQAAWTVSSANIAEGIFIFAQVDRASSYPVSEGEALCGILVLDMPLLNGGQILTIWLAVCLACIPLGLWLWGFRRAGIAGNLKALAVVALGGLLVSLWGLWVVGVACLVVSVLLAVGLLASSVSGRG